MTIDLRTLIFVLGITNLIQVIAISFQYLINRTYQGIGWWLLAFLSLAAGFVLSLLRDVITVKLITIFAASALTFSGPIFVYIGVMRFLGKKELRGLVIGAYMAFLLPYFYFTFVQDEINIRSTISAFLIAFFSFLTAQGIFTLKMRSITTSANFLSAVWFTQGSFFTLRTVILFTQSPLNTLFTPALIQTSTYLFTISISLLVTFGLIIMINQRLNAETREARDHFELIFHTSPDATLITRLTDGVIVEANEGFSTISGYSRDEVVGKSSLAINIYQNPIDHQNIVAELGKKGSCENYEALFQRKDGSLLNGVMFAKVFTMHDIPHIISITRDISERVQVETKIRQINAELEQRVAERTAHLEAANKDLASFTYSISHDLNIPVRAIAGFSQILMEEYHNQLDGEGQRLLSVIRKNTHKLDELIKDMLALLRVSQGELKISSIDMTGLVQSVYLETASPEQQTLFTFSLSPLANTHGDEGLLRLIWGHLIANAVKFTLPKEQPTIEVGSMVEDGAAIYYIKDNGVGFNPHYTHKLFNLFERLHKADQFEGSGVGLAIVQRAVQRLGGKVWVESAIDQGATFFFSIPERQVTDEQPG